MAFNLIVTAVSERAAQLLIDVIDIHIDGIQGAKAATTQDPTVQTADELLDLMAEYDQDIHDLERIKERLAHAIG